VKSKDLREFTTTEKDLERGISRIPLQLSRLNEEDLLDDQSEALVPNIITEPGSGGDIREEIKQAAVVNRGNKQYYYKGVNRMTSSVQEEICDTEDMEKLEEIIEQRQLAQKFSNVDGKNGGFNSYGEDYGADENGESATDDEGDSSRRRDKLAPLFKKSTQKDASFDDFKIITMLGKGTFGKVIKNSDVLTAIMI
jgi:hypothetical protein